MRTNLEVYMCMCAHICRERSVSAQQACSLSEKAVGMLWLAPRGGQQNHLIDGSEPRAVYLHVCFAEEIRTERQCPQW